MNEWMERLSAYGVNMEETLERFVNDEELYARCFDLFLEDDSLEKLGTALREGKQQDAFAAAHTMKGTAGNMGFTPLYEALCEIVEPLRAGTVDGLDEKYQAVMQEYERIRALR